MRTGWLLALALTVSACDQPVPPQVVHRQLSLDDDDLAVVRALFDDLLRPGWLTWPGARFLVVDMTMAMCRRDPAAFGPQPGRCLLPRQSEFVSEILSAQISRIVTLNFAEWNATPLSISGPLGDGVTYVSPTLTDTVVPRELLRQYPPGSTVVMLSAPGYPAPRMAVIYFTAATSSGAARLERAPDGRWRVTGHVTRPVD